MVVLDTSAAFHIAVQTNLGKEMSHLIESGEEVVVPSHFDVEFANLLAKYVEKTNLTLEAAAFYTREISKLITKRIDTHDLVSEILQEAIRLNSNAYDIAYLVITRRNAATLLTGNKTLADLCKSNGVKVFH